MIRIPKDRLDRENHYVLMTMQSLLGLIDPAVEAVALQIKDDELDLWFWTAGSLAGIREDAEEVVGDLVAFLSPEDILINTKIIEGSPPADVHGWARMIYRRKRPA
jgi:hypothetical protein